MIPLENNTYRLILSGNDNNNGDYWEQTFHYFITDTSPGSHNAFSVAAELCEQWDAIRRPAYIDLLPDNVILKGVSCRRVDAIGGPLVTKNVTHGGGAGSESETIGNGAQITWFGEEDPILEGRSYFPGIPNDAFDLGVWDVAYAANAQTFIDAMVDDLSLFGGVADANFTIVSYQIGIAQQLAKHGLLRAIPGTQRRRLRR